MHRRKVLGVMVVQQQAKRRFGESEEAFLVTLSAQISGVVAHARALGQLDNLHAPKNVNSPRIFHGVAGASGIAMGRAVVIYPPADIDSVPDRAVEDIDSELAQLNQALNAVRGEMQMLGNKMTESLMPEERALFDVYLRMLDDNALGGEISEKVQAGNWAQGALRAVIEDHMQSFAAMDDPYLRERMADVRDLGRRILAHLQRQNTTSRDYAENSILIGEEISTATLVETPMESIAAIVTTTGAANSHMAIVARALGIPTVVGVAELTGLQPRRRRDDRRCLSIPRLCPSLARACASATRKSSARNGNWWPALTPTATCPPRRRMVTRWCCMSTPA
jgi:phosphotransferase system enzyme I (PtsP)